MDNIQKGELLNVIAILKKSEMQTAWKVKVGLYLTLEEEKCEFEIDYDPSMIKNEDDFIFSIAAKELIMRATRDKEEKD